MGNAHVYLGPPRSGRRRGGRVGGAGVVLVAIGLLAACTRGSNETLSERADKYWQLKQQKRWEEVYDGYLDPALKSALTKDAFLKKRLLAFDILNFKVSDARENGENGTVHVTLEANLPLRGIGGKVQLQREQMTSDDSWVKRDGTWYIHLSE